jgi:predicted nucleic acid-binding protein
MKVALDTNVLAYAEGANGAVMRDKALELIQRLPQGSIVLPVQGGSPRGVHLAWSDCHQPV